MKKRLLSVLLVLLLCAGAILSGKYLPLYTEPTDPDSASDTLSYDKESVYLWYTDEVMTSYISSAAVAYNETHGTRIIPVLRSGLDYLESVNRETIDHNIPDLYVISNDALGRAYLAGLADQVGTEDDFGNLYLNTAINAVSYKDKPVAYPLCFETTALIYNKDYLRDMAVTSLMREEIAEEGNEDAGEEPPDEDGFLDESKYEEADISARALEIIPVTMAGITSLADGYTAPEGVEAFLKWDVTDIFYNYFFLGDAIKVGGEQGWDKGILDIYNENAIRALEEYQKLNNYFSIDTSDIDYDGIIREFVEGKIVFTIATTDVVATLEQAKADGEFPYEYGVALIPDMNGELETRSLSTVNCVAVNPFSTHGDVARDFARFMTSEYAGELYGKTGKLSAAKDMTYENEALNKFVEEFEFSIPMPKMMETSNLWVQLEAAFAQIWDGEDANETLKVLAEQMIYQTRGEKVILDPILLEEETQEMEYLDEEALINEARSQEDEEGE